MDSDLRRNWLSVVTHSHTWSGRADHGGTIMPPDNYVTLAAWCQQHQIDALGMGSPYTPHAADAYRKFDRESPGSYYEHPEAHPDILKAEQLEVETMLDAANALAHGHTTFYLDNETPKARYGHLWWINHHPEFAAWHDYDQIFDRWMCTHPDAMSDVNEPMPYERRPYMQIIAQQRKHGAVGVWAHPTSWWFGREDGRFITNLATEMPAHAFAEGRLDGMVVMGYHADRPEYRALWLALLDRGVRVTPMAEMDMSLSDENLMDRDRVYRSYVYCDAAGDPRTPLESRLAEGVRLGQVVCSTGPMMTLTVDAAMPGETMVTSRTHVHDVTVRLESTPTGRPWDRVQLLGREGRVLAEARDVESGMLTWRIRGEDQAGYMVALALSNPRTTGRHEHVVVTSAVTLLPRGSQRREPMTTDLTLRVGPASALVHGEVYFETATGERLGEAMLSGDVLMETLPASGRITLKSPEGLKQTHYLINANARLLEVQRYLYRGRFLRDWPDLKPGELPVEVWHLDQYEQAMRQMEITV